MVAHDVVVVAEMGQHLFVTLLAMPKSEAMLHFDRIARPIQGGGLAEQRAAATVEQAANNLVLRIVIGGLRIRA